MVHGVRRVHEVHGVHSVRQVRGAIELQRGRASLGGDAADRLHDVGDLARPQHGVDFGHFRAQLVAVAFGQAARHDEPLAGSVLLVAGHLQNRVHGFLFGRVDERAGVDHEHVGARGVRGELVARLAREPQHDL